MNVATVRAIAKVSSLVGAGVRETEIWPRESWPLRRWSGFPAFAERNLMIVSQGGLLVPLRLNWIQQQIYAAEQRLRAEKKPAHILVLKYRKGGVTTLQQAMSYWETWRKPHRWCRTYAHRKDDTRIIFEMVQRYAEYQVEFRPPTTSTASYRIDFPDRGSWFAAETAGASSSGRGQTLRLQTQIAPAAAA